MFVIFRNDFLGEIFGLLLKIFYHTDAFDHPYWDWVRSRIAGKATEIRAQGLFGAAMLPYSELEYGGIVAKMNKLEKKIYGEKTRIKKLVTTSFLFA